MQVLIVTTGIRNAVDRLAASNNARRVVGRSLDVDIRDIIVAHSDDGEKGITIIAPKDIEMTDDYVDVIFQTLRTLVPNIILQMGQIIRRLE